MLLRLLGSYAPKPALLLRSFRSLRSIRAFNNVLMFIIAKLFLIIILFKFTALRHSPSKAPCLCGSYAPMPPLLPRSLGNLMSIGALGAFEL